MKKTSRWFVYMIKCANGNLYTGITKDLKRRLNEHRSGKGARYTRSFGAEGIVHSEYRKSMGSALKREAEIKSLSRKEKLMLIGSKQGN